MRNLSYPVLLYSLRKNAVLGILLSQTPLRMVGRTDKDVLKAFQEYLLRQYKKSGEFEEVEREEVRMRNIQVQIKPTYQDRRGHYPINEELLIPVTAVFGLTDSGYWECDLPLLDQSFSYDEAGKMEELAQYFAANKLNQLPPYRLHQILLMPLPRLEMVQLRVNEDREYDWDYSFQAPLDNLERLAERVPGPRLPKAKGLSFPEAAWERETEVEEVAAKLMQQRASVLVVGEKGSGKSTVLRQAVRRVHQRTKKSDRPLNCWKIEPRRIVASKKYLGEWEESVESLIYELANDHAMLWIENFMELLRAGGEGPEDSIAAFLIGFLQQGRVQLIGELDTQELDSIQRLLPAFAEQFQIVSLQELSEARIRSILFQYAQYSQKNWQTRIESSALDLIYRLQVRYFPYESFPGKGVRFLGQCVYNTRNRGFQRVTRKRVIEQLIHQTGLPGQLIQDELKLKEGEVRDYFQTRIIGQEAVVAKMVELVKVFKAGLNNPHKPIATLLFAGPTGVGKTASAKALSEYFFGKGQKKNPLVRIDMSEFQNPYQIDRLIGRGQEVGKLVQEIRERPFSVLLLDEIEKAHPVVFDLLLNVLDEGVLTDAFGRVTNFRNTIIIMTSNIGSTGKKSIGFMEREERDKVYLSAVSSFFRPEFVNRIDHIVVFHSLDQKMIRRIARKELESLNEREGLKKKGISLQFTDALVNQLSQVGFDEALGARPLQRAIEDEVVHPVGKWLLKNSGFKKKPLTLDFKSELHISSI
jgi:ATP-dependent Clp protease ATP-binding subunit ClpC